MDSITLKNYRCFAGEQTARLAPLTLLVGENSTGKTSFLAMVRALWDVMFNHFDPLNFREYPYDLGAFEDIVHNSASTEDKVPDSFEAGFSRTQSQPENDAMSFHATFKDHHGTPFPETRRIEGKCAWIDAQSKEDSFNVIFGTPRDEWIYHVDFDFLRFDSSNSLYFRVSTYFADLRGMVNDKTPDGICETIPTLSELEELSKIVRALYSGLSGVPRPFASSPVRSRPMRTYDPVRHSTDPDGWYIPSYLARMYRQDADEWQELKSSLEEFGRKSELFDDISVRSFGDTGGAPFQMLVRKWGKRRKGAHRNLIDVGYGVSQALPLLTELLRPDAPNMFLLQQPEVHLHPSAQAALGSLFCDVAASGKQLIVETHSDYIIDRVRMDVRDRETGLKPEDVSILYFERDELDVNIHSITIDEQGNLQNCPDSYGDFFMAETRRLVGI